MAKGIQQPADAGIVELIRLMVEVNGIDEAAFRSLMIRTIGTPSLDNLKVAGALKVIGAIQNAGGKGGRIKKRKASAKPRPRKENPA